MLKKVLCMVIIAVTIMTTCGAVGAGAATADVAQTQSDNTTVVVGDVDLDGDVSVIDASTLQSALAGLIELTDTQWLVSKTTNNENVSVLDATEIQMYLAGIGYYDNIGKTITVSDNDDNKDEDTEISVKDTEAIEKAIAKRFIELVNEERARVGVVKLSEDAILTKAAKLRSEELIDSFSHTRPDGTICYTAIEDTSNFGMMGENVAYHGGIVELDYQETLEKDIEKAAKMFYGQFKSSEGHYENMIREGFNCHGVGVTIIVQGGVSKCYIAHMFADKVR